MTDRMAPIWPAWSTIAPAVAIVVSLNVMIASPFLMMAALKPRNRPRELKVLCGISADVLATWRKDPDHPLHPIKDANHWEYSKERVLEFFAANLHRSTGEYATTAQEGEG